MLLSTGSLKFRQLEIDGANGENVSRNTAKTDLIPALSRCNPQKNPLPSADYVASGRRTLQGRFSDEKRLC